MKKRRGKTRAAAVRAGWPHRLGEGHSARMGPIVARMALRYKSERRRRRFPFRRNKRALFPARGAGGVTFEIEILYRKDTYDNP